MKTKVLFPASLAPIHRGHLQLIFKALADYDEVIIAVGNNDNKNLWLKKDLLCELVRDAIDDELAAYELRQLNGRQFAEWEVRALGKLKTKMDCIKVIGYEGLTVDEVLRRGITHVLRGTRSDADSWEEASLAFVNNELLRVRRYSVSRLEYEAEGAQCFFSSTTVRELLNHGEYAALHRFITPTVHRKLVTQSLFHRFAETLSFFGYGYPEGVMHIWNKLCSQYEKGRFYHTLSHIGYMLNYIDIYNRSVRKLTEREYKELCLAVFYHDYIYCDNDAEMLSGLAVAECLTLLAPEVCTRVHNMIEATDHPAYLDNNELNECESLISDADMAFMADEVFFLTASQLIFQESVMTIEEFREKYSPAIERMIAAQHLFKLPFFKQNFAAPARENLSKALKLIHKND